MVFICSSWTGEVVGVTRASPKRESFVGVLQKSDFEGLLIHPIDSKLPRRIGVHPANLPEGAGRELLAEAEAKELGARTLVCSTILGWDRSSNRPAAKVNIQLMSKSQPSLVRCKYNSAYSCYSAPPQTPRNRQMQEYTCRTMMMQYTSTIFPMTPY